LKDWTHLDTYEAIKATAGDGGKWKICTWKACQPSAKWWNIYIC